MNDVVAVHSNLYVVDGSIADAEIILSAIESGGRPREIAYIDFANASSDVVARISDAAAKHRDLASLHIFSHGRPGALVSGATVIDANELLERAEDLARIGAALAPGGDILLYGCDVGAGEEGREFIGRFAELTGANVAASETPTGAADRGGDWRLEARVGSVTAPVLQVPAYPGILVSASAAPAISGLAPVSVTEGGAAASVAPGISVSGGSNYGGGSVTFKLTSPVAGDQFLLTGDSDPNAAGAISISGASVYYGTGSAHIQIGVVDSVENGQNGQPLTVDFVRNFTNASFENGTAGWTIGESRVILGTTSINGHVTPSDTTIPPNAGDDAGGIVSMTYSSQLSTGEHTDGTQSLRLYNSGTTDAGYDVVHGPYAYSDTFAAVAGDTFYFDWRAAAGGDAYDAFGYLMNADTGAYQVVLNETGADSTGNTPWATSSVTIPTSGNWFFVFVGGTYDFSGGRAVGGSLYIDNFRVAVGSVTDSMVAAVASHVGYQSTGDAALDDRNLQVVISDSAGTQASATATVEVVNVNDAPTGAVSLSGTPAQGRTLTAANTIADADGFDPAGVSYHWQRLGSDGNWHDIAGATGDSYTLTQDDVRSKVRAVASYTDRGGTAETVAGAESRTIEDAHVPPTGGLAIGGTAAQGETLALTDTVADADGIVSSAYQWQRWDGSAWVDISGATGTSYVLTQADVGHDVRAELRYVDGDGLATTVSSAAMSAIANVNVAPTGELALDGAAAQGRTLTLTDTVADADGIASSAYQWQRWDGSAWVDISGATGTSYVLTQADVGHDVRAELRYVDGDGLATTVSSAATSAIANVNDAPAGAVVANGAAVQGRTLTATNTVTDADGISTPGTYQWQRQGADGLWHDIVGATAATYALTQGDVGARMRAVLHYVDDAGVYETVAGAATGVVANVNELPVVQDDRFAEMRNARTVAIDVLANDTDPDGDVLHITKIDGHDIAPGGSVTLGSGTVTLDGSGHLVFSPFLTFDGDVSFTYTAEDGAGGASAGRVTGSVATAPEWSALGHDLQDVVGATGLAMPHDLNDLIYAASVVLPGAFITSEDARFIVGYQPGAGLDLVVGDVLPDADVLSRMLLALSQTRDSSVAPVLATDAHGAWTSSVDQSLLFQTALGSDQDVRIDYGDGSTSFSGAASSGWSRSFALQSLRPDFSADLVTQSDGNAQGQLHEASVTTGSALSIDIGGLQAGTPQAGLSNKYGFVDFVTPDAHSAVAISRSVAVADTLGGADDQTAVVHMRQNGVSDVSVMFYKVDDLSGSIDGIDPGDARYGAATEGRAYHLSDGGTWLKGGGYGQYGEGEIAGVDNGDIIAMRLHTGAGDDFYAFANANSDNQAAHLWGYGYNTWGWEDTAGGGDRDFNDLVVQLDFVGKQLDGLLLS